MTGGLVQITTYGTQDIMLSGNPQITFFTMIYRRYTNFGKKTIEQSFENKVDFDTKSIAIIPKSGDLLSNITLRIKLPRYNLKIINELLATITNTNQQYTDLLTYIDFYNTYLKKFTTIVNKILYDLIDTFDIVNIVKNEILTNITTQEITQIINIILYIYNNDTSITNYFTNATLFKFVNNTLEYIYEGNITITYEIMCIYLQRYLEILNIFGKKLYDTHLDNIKNKRIYMNWINKIGIYLFDTIEFFIGSNSINKLSSDYINIHSQLYYQNQSLYDNIINNNIPKYISEDVYLYLPLPLWFEQKYGLAFPLVALQHNEIKLVIKTKNITECINWTFINEIDKNLLNKTLIENYNNTILSDLEISCLIEYIYLDNLERSKFAKSGHEYLITQVQELTFKNIDMQNNQFDLDFFHCSKELYWVCKNNNTNMFYDINNSNKYSSKNIDYINYIEQLGDNKRKFDVNIYNNGLIYLHNNIETVNIQEDIKKVNTFYYDTIIPIIKSSLIINGNNLANYEQKYFSCLHPYNYFKNSPEKGINVYSFSLSPTEIQPSGTCNFSRLPKVSLRIQLNPNLDTNNNEYDLKVFCVNYNILRIIGGLAGLAYTYNS